MDILARKLDMDTAQLRAKNFVKKEQFPYPSPLGFTYDSGDYATTLKKALDQIGYDALRKEQAEKRKRGEEEMRQFVSLAENSTDFIGVASLDGEVLFVNAAGQTNVGLAGNEQVRGTKIPDYLAEQDLERFANRPVNRLHFIRMNQFGTLREWTN